MLVIEATGLGGATLPLVLLPGLVAAGVGSLVFIGLGSFSGFSTAAWSLRPFPLPPFGGPAGVTSPGLSLRRCDGRVPSSLSWRPPLVEATFSITRSAHDRGGLAVGGLAIAFAESTHKSPDAVLFSGQEVLRFAIRASDDDLALDARAAASVQGVGLVDLVGSFCGGPTFRDLPRRGRGTDGAAPARLCRVAGDRALVGAACVSVLPLPLASVMIASSSGEGRTRSRSADRCCRCGGIPDERDADGVRRFAVGADRTPLEPESASAAASPAG